MRLSELEVLLEEDPEDRAARMNLPRVRKVIRNTEAQVTAGLIKLINPELEKHAKLKALRSVAFTFQVNDLEVLSTKIARQPNYEVSLSVMFEATAVKDQELIRKLKSVSGTRDIEYPLTDQVVRMFNAREGHVVRSSVYVYLDDGFKLNALHSRPEKLIQHRSDDCKFKIMVNIDVKFHELEGFIRV